MVYSWIGLNGFSSNVFLFEVIVGGYYELEFSNVDGEIVKVCVVVVGGNGEFIVVVNIMFVFCD